MSLAIRPMSTSPQDYPPEDVSPELGALVAIALVLLLGGGARVGYFAARIVLWLM